MDACPGACIPEGLNYLWAGLVRAPECRHSGACRVLSPGSNSERSRTEHAGSRFIPTWFGVDSTGEVEIAVDGTKPESSVAVGGTNLGPTWDQPGTEHGQPLLRLRREVAVQVGPQKWLSKSVPYPEEPAIVTPLSCRRRPSCDRRPRQPRAIRTSIRPHVFARAREIRTSLRQPSPTPPVAQMRVSRPASDPSNRRRRDEQHGCCG